MMVIAEKGSKDIVTTNSKLPQPGHNLKAATGHHLRFYNSRQYIMVDN